MPFAALFNFSVVDAVKGNDKMENLATTRKGPLNRACRSQQRMASVPAVVVLSALQANAGEDVDYDDQDADDGNFDEGD